MLIFMFVSIYVLLLMIHCLLNSIGFSSMEMKFFPIVENNSLCFKCRFHVMEN